MSINVCCDRVIQLSCWVPFDTRDALSSPPVGLMLKKLNLTQQKQTVQEQSNNKKTKWKPESKENLNQYSSLRNADICVHITVCNVCTQYSAEEF